MKGDGPLILCYDGSENAAHAIASAARLVGGGPALVVHVWTDADSETDPEHHARQVVDEGVRLAREAGFDAEPVPLRTYGPVPEMIVAQVEQRDAPLVVMGSRGLSDYTAALFGSVSTSVLHSSPRPVLVVPNGRTP